MLFLINCYILTFIFALCRITTCHVRTFLNFIYLLSQLLIEHGKETGQITTSLQSAEILRE